jgi:hypothetical protein
MRKSFYVIGLFWFSVVLGSSSVYAQGPPTKYDEKSKDASDVKFALKLNATSLISGELPLSFEYRFIERLGVEAGAGLILPYYVNFEFLNSKIGSGFGDDNHTPFTNKEMGYSLFFSFNTYIGVGDWWNVFVNPYIHHRHYSTVNVLNCGLEFGYQVIFFNALLLDFAPRLYWKHEKSLDQANTKFYRETMRFPIDMTLSIKIGYAF